MAEKRAAQLDMFSTAETLRDEALERVLRNAGEWYPRAFAQAMTEIARRPGESKTGEQLRLLVYRVVGEPHHHNVWGAVTRELIKIGMLEEIGSEHMTTPKSHGRRTPLYRLVPQR